MRFLIHSRITIEGITVKDDRLSIIDKSGKSYQWKLKLVGIGLMIEETVSVVLKCLPIKC